MKKKKTKYFIDILLTMIFLGIAWTSRKVTISHLNAQVVAFWRYAIPFITIIPVVLYMKISF